MNRAIGIVSGSVVALFDKVSSGGVNKVMQVSTADPRAAGSVLVQDIKLKQLGSDGKWVAGVPEGVFKIGQAVNIQCVFRPWKMDNGAFGVDVTYFHNGSKK